MQHTEKYQFKLIDGTDDFSPTPLNDNAQKTEDLIEGVEQDLSDLAQEVEDKFEGLNTAGKLARIALGSYVGTGGVGPSAPNSISVDFYPVYLILIDATSHTYNSAATQVMRGMTSYQAFMSSTIQWNWQDKAVSWYLNNSTASYAPYQHNESGHTYLYCVLGYTQE